MKKLLLLTLCTTMLLSCFMAGCTEQPADPAETSTDIQETTVQEETTMEIETTGEIVTEPETELEVEIETEEEIRVLTRQLSGVRIVTGETPTEIYAGEELQKYLEKRGVPVDAEGGYLVTSASIPPWRTTATVSWSSAATTRA